MKEVTWDNIYCRDNHERGAQIGGLWLIYGLWSILFSQNAIVKRMRNGVF